MAAVGGSSVSPRGAAGEPESEQDMIGSATMEREVLVLATGGTISMRGARAVPAFGAAELLAGVGLDDVEARELLGAPGAHVSLDDALLVARTAAGEAAGGRGVVVTHGTDTLEETAVLCDLLHAADAPVVFTGAIRPSSAAGGVARRVTPSPPPSCRSSAASTSIPLTRRPAWWPRGPSTESTSGTRR